mmetsp:Transcript_13618/g.32902  ORF Transcript_13618/g.32902 Transcript_13618/m.32902 type:complete len:309 (-) Transcript_13618:474-1400(-)
MMPGIGNDDLGSNLFSHLFGDSVEPFFGGNGNGRHDQGQFARHYQSCFCSCCHTTGLMQNFIQLLIGHDSHGNGRCDERQTQKQGPNGFKFPMSIGMIFVGGQASNLDGPEGDKIRDQVTQGMPGIGNERRRMLGNPHDQFADTEDQIDNGTQPGNPIGVTGILAQFFRNDRGRLGQIGFINRCQTRMLDNSILESGQFGNVFANGSSCLVGSSQSNGGNGKGEPIRLFEGLFQDEGRTTSGHPYDSHQGNSSSETSLLLLGCQGSDFLGFFVLFFMIMMIVMTVRMSHVMESCSSRTTNGGSCCCSN